MEKVRIQDDLYLHVNQETIDNLVIPDDQPRTGGFSSLDSDVEKLMMGEFVDMCKSGEYPNEYLKNACALYLAAKNTRKRSAHGVTPALKYLATIQKLDSISAFNRKLKTLMLGRYPLPFYISVGADMKDTQHNCVSISGPSTILPDASFYKPERAQQKEMLIGIWVNMAKTVLAKTKLSAEEQEKYLTETLAFDEKIASLVKTREEWSEYVKAYNPMKTGKVCYMMRPVAMRKLLNSVFGFVPEKIIVE